MARENRKTSFEYALRDEGENLHSFRGLKKYGITLEVLQEFSHKDATSSVLAAIDRRSAFKLWHQIYWKHLSCDSLTDGLDYFVFDSSLVCGGPRVVGGWLQLLAFPAGTGSFDESIEYLNSIELETAICGVEFYRRRRLRCSPTWPVLGAEWTNRCNRAKQRALVLGASTKVKETA